MSWRHGVYFASAIAAGGLVLELGWWAGDRIHTHLVDRGVRVIDGLRGTMRI